MSTNGDLPDHQLLFLEELVEEHASVSGEVVEVDTNTWAIHGSVAVDGDVIMAEYSSESQARFVLEELRAFEAEHDGTE